MSRCRESHVPIGPSAAQVACTVGALALLSAAAAFLVVRVVLRVA